MDLGFSRFDAPRPDTAAIPVDYFRLLATVTATQVAGRTAMVEAILATEARANTSPSAAIVELFNAGPGWTGAVTALRSSFHPDLARKSGQMVDNGE